jgi:hypothetical protein
MNQLKLFDSPITNGKLSGAMAFSGAGTFSSRWSLRFNATILKVQT